MSNIKLLHISAHLGGGVGRVLSKVAHFRHKTQMQIDETFLCLEEPKDKKFIKVLSNAGAVVEICTDLCDAQKLIASADIVQIEWWHHPLIPGFLSTVGSCDARLVVWCHVSGRSYPFIPNKLLTFPDLCIFTTPVSKIFNDLSPENKKSNTAVVHSSGGFDDLPTTERSIKTGLTLKCGYIGTYNFAKLHPKIVQFIEAANHVDFKMNFYGDISAADELIKQMKVTNYCDNRIFLNGYINEPSSVLMNLDLFVYLLNPLHYGTTENALLEAMACGVVPIVIDNPVERTIVTHKETGFLVNTPKEFASVLNFCKNNPDEILRMSRNCCTEIRKRFSLKRTEKELRTHYLKLVDSSKQHHNFRELFGKKPEEWFSFALGDYSHCFQPKSQDLPESRIKRLSCPIFYEKTKSSVRHFFQYYPKSKQLGEWLDLLNDDLNYL